ncbi:hypothetical protein D9M69_464480 [compost metagenome]
MLEGRREGGHQVVDQHVDIGDELTGGAGRQLQRLGLARLVEVVDVDPVRRRVQALGLGLEVALDEGEATGARLAHHIDVVAGTRHRHAELQGFDGAFLAKHAAERLELLGDDETELVGREGTGQRFGRQAQASGEGIGHRESLGDRGEMTAFWRWPSAAGKASFSARDRRRPGNIRPPAAPAGAPR